MAYVAIGIGVVAIIVGLVVVPYGVKTISSALGYNTATQISQQE